MDFGDLNQFASRAIAAYETADVIRARYPQTVVVSSPGTTGVQYFVERDEEAHTQHLTIRGTADGKNLLEDLEVRVHESTTTAIPVAAGFETVARAIFQDATPHLDRRHATYVTGHSLGGAVAAILALSLIDDGYDVEQVVTFGQPRFTTTSGLESGQLRALAGILTRVVDENDVVPMLPPATRRHSTYGPFEHVGREIILLEGPYYVELQNHIADRLSVDESWRSLIASTLADHHMAHYVDRLSTKLAGAARVPYADREQYVAKPKK